MPDTTREVRIPSELLQSGIEQDEMQRRVNGWLVMSGFSDGHISC